MLTKGVLGVRQRSQFWYGGMQRGSILISGYSSNKRLRTPELKQTAQVGPVITGLKFIIQKERLNVIIGKFINCLF
jgi:hypothetical protein